VEPTAEKPQAPVRPGIGTHAEWSAPSVPARLEAAPDGALQCWVGASTTSRP